MRLREKPRETATVVGYLDRNDVVRVLRAQPDWTQVAAKNGRGYVASRFIRSVPAPEPWSWRVSASIRTQSAQAWRRFTGFSRTAIDLFPVSLAIVMAFGFAYAMLRVLRRLPRGIVVVSEASITAIIILFVLNVAAIVTMAASDVLGLPVIYAPGGLALLVLTTACVVRLHGSARRRKRTTYPDEEQVGMSDPRPVVER